MKYDYTILSYNCIVFYTVSITKQLSSILNVKIKLLSALKNKLFPAVFAFVCVDIFCSIMEKIIIIIIITKIIKAISPSPSNSLMSVSASEKPWYTRLNAALFIIDMYTYIYIIYIRKLYIWGMYHFKTFLIQGTVICHTQMCVEDFWNRCSFKNIVQKHIALHLEVFWIWNQL